MQALPVDAIANANNVQVVTTYKSGYNEHPPTGLRTVLLEDGRLLPVPRAFFNFINQANINTTEDNNWLDKGMYKEGSGTTPYHMS